MRNPFNEKMFSAEDVVEYYDYLVDLEDEDNEDEIELLKKFIEELKKYNAIRNNALLIDESYFEEYCEEMCEDLGYISKDFPNWIVIDWEATADNLKHDYNEIVFDETIYLYESY